MRMFSFSIYCQTMITVSSLVYKKILVAPCPRQQLALSIVFILSHFGCGVVNRSDIKNHNMNSQVVIPQRGTAIGKFKVGRDCFICGGVVPREHL